MQFSEDPRGASVARRERLARGEERVAVDRSAAQQRPAVLRRVAHRRQAHPHRRPLRRTVSYPFLRVFYFKGILP